MNKPQSSMAADAKTVQLDVRDLHPRERHQTIFSGLEDLDLGDTLRLVNDHDPVPLRYQLEAEFPNYYEWTNLEAGPEKWVVDITSRVRVVDARPIIASGGEPFGEIMGAASSIRSGEALVVYAPFEPIPLEGVLGEQGFEHVTHQIDDNNWRVTFARP